MAAVEKFLGEHPEIAEANRISERTRLSNAKLDAINGAIDKGHTVYLCTYTRAYKIDAKVRERFERAGHPVLKVGPKTGSLLLASGRSYVCADLCALRVEEAV